MLQSFANLILTVMLVVATACSPVAAEAPQAQPPSLSSGEAELYWGQWRGPLATGIAPHADPPVEWSETHNVRWKTPLPGRGHASPIVWGDRVYLTTAVPFGDSLAPRFDDAPGTHDSRPVTQRHRFEALAIDRADGEIIWRRVLSEELPHEGGHTTGTYASPSPVTDGEHLFAFFGSYGLYGLDLSGEVLWRVDLGDMRTKHAHGEGGSPVLHGETLVVNWDHEGESFVVAFDKRTGEERWRVARDEVTSWATPIVVEHDGVTQVVVSGTRRVRGYDLGTGEVLWECGGLSHNVVASPVAADGIVYAGSSYERNAMLAIRLEGARGDLTGTDHVLWFRRRGTPYVPSPLLYGDSLYFLQHYQGFLTRVDARTGTEPHRAVRLAGLGDVYASPIGAAERVYITDRSGVTIVLSTDSPPKELARNLLEDRFSASAAAVGAELFLRGERFLYCLAADQVTPPSCAARLAPAAIPRGYEAAPHTEPSGPSFAPPRRARPGSGTAAGKISRCAPPPSIAPCRVRCSVSPS